jgi:hypothetical protein
LGYVSSEQFVINTLTNFSYLTSGTTTSTVKGLTVLGDIQYSGKILNKYLTLDLNLSYLTTSDNLYSPSSTATQNYRIADVLRSVFPINTGIDPIPPLGGTPSLAETGVPVNSEARVLCYSTSTPNVYQVRLFRADQSGVWMGKHTGSASTADNVVSEFTRI